MTSTHSGMHSRATRWCDDNKQLQHMQGGACTELYCHVRAQCHMLIDLSSLLNMLTPSSNSPMRAATVPACTMHWHASSFTAQHGSLSKADACPSSTAARGGVRACRCAACGMLYPDLVLPAWQLLGTAHRCARAAKAATCACLLGALSSRTRDATASSCPASCDRCAAGAPAQQRARMTAAASELLWSVLQSRRISTRRACGCSS